MAIFKYFAGDKELSGIREINGKLFGYVSKEQLFFVEGKGWQGYTAVERVVNYKSNPSRHECDARCVNATGLIMKCECSCGGKNHGCGSLSCEPV
jgi:hypothetical protein